MKVLVAILVAAALGAGLQGCASVSGVIQSDATFSEKMKRLGGIVGDFFEGPSGNRADAVKKYDYAGRSNLLEIEEVKLVPDVASAGQAVQATVRYTALSPAATQKVNIVEMRTLRSPTDSMLLARRELVQEQGTHTSTMKFTIPNDLGKGSYTLITSVADGVQTRTASSSLRIP
jgi:hypothetical protein